jgi:hypothetical protein
VPVAQGTSVSDPLAARQAFAAVGHASITEHGGRSASTLPANSAGSEFTDGEVA